MNESELCAPPLCNRAKNHEGLHAGGNVEYFGPEFARKEWEIQVDTPVGALCGDCEEPIEEHHAGTYEKFLEGEPHDLRASRKPVHYECSMRRVIGSEAHVLGVCSCNVPGSQEGDEPSLTRRQAAIAAVRAWNARR